MQKIHAAIPIVCGFVAITAAVYPELLVTLAKGIERFRNSFAPFSRRESSVQADEIAFNTRLGLVVIGVGFLVLGAFALSA